MTKHPGLAPLRLSVLLAASGWWGVLHLGVSDAAQPLTGSPAACLGLRNFQLDGVTLSEATVVAADTPIPTDSPPAKIEGQPGHCLVRGEVGHHVAADGHEYGDKFELRLPMAWSHRLLFQGGGGLNGIVRPAVGLVTKLPAVSSALARGYAVVSTDSGHDQSTLAAPGDFGADPQSLADYEFNSTRLVMGIALEVTRAFYHRRPDRSYFMGCSTGGREALVAAQRYPELFDGIIAGTPAFHLTRVMVGEVWNTETYAAIAPKNASGNPALAQALTEHDLHLLSAAVLSKCDALDGVRDGMINDPLACHFDPQVLACKADQENDCLSRDKVAAIRKVFDGAKDPTGQAVYSDWFYDSGVSEPGWRAWMLGTEKMPAINQLIAPAAINGMALGHQPPPIDTMHFDFIADTQRIDKVADQLNAVATDYDRLKKHGGKLLMYVGVSDPVFSASDLVRYYRSVSEANGGTEKTQEFARLFLVPGMNHCSGGLATDEFDPLEALQSWVERGRKPERIIAKGAAFPGRTRPLCAFPAVARYAGSKDPESADNFVCR